MNPARRTPLLLLAIVVTSLIPVLAAAQPHRLVESFDSTFYRDPEATTAWWDTGAGELKLFPLEPSIVGSWASPGSCYGIACDGNRAFVCAGSAGLQIVDISDPTDPVFLGDHDTPGSAWGVAVEGTMAYVADYTGHLQVVDVSNPSSPFLRGSATASQAIMKLVVAGDRLYAAARSAGIAVFDVSDPGSPVLLAYGDTPGTAFDVTVAGNHAYVADGGSGLQVLDVTDPSAPVTVGSVSTSGTAYGVAVQGDLAYVSDDGLGLTVVDVSDPASPVQLGTLGLPDTGWSVRVDGDVAYLGGGTAGVLIVDVGDPTAPTVLATADTPGAARDAAVSGRYLVTADYGGGLQVIEMRSAHNTPREISSVAVAGPAWAVDVDGDLACVATNGGLELVDVGDPGQPQLLATFRPDLSFTRVLIDGDLAYARANLPLGLMIIDISNPSSPFSVAYYPTAVDDLAVAGDLLYLVYAEDGTGHLRVIDISNPASPVLVGEQLAPDGALRIDLEGDLAYLTGRQLGLLVFSILDPTNPVQIASASLPGLASDVLVSGDHAYVTNGDGDLAVVDVSIPVAPSLVTSISLPSAGYDLAMSGQRLFVACAWEGPQVVDVENPAAPIILGGVTGASGPCYSLTLQGDDLYAPQYDSRLTIYEAFARSLDVASNRARSLPLGDPDHDVARVRLITTQTDAIAWQINTTLGDDSFLEIAADGAWERVPTGNRLTWQADLFTTGSGMGPSCQELTLDWRYACAALDSIVDVPDDQGGQLRLHFVRSGLDFADEPELPIVHYGVWQRVDDVALRGAIEVAPATAASPVEMPLRSLDGRTYLAAAEARRLTTFPPGDWELVTTVPSTQLDQYQVRVTTVQDGVESVYCVTAHTTWPAVWYCSSPLGGTSLDNIAPAVPAGLELVTPGLLAWDDPVDEDFQYFSVYGSSSPELDEAAVFIDHTTDTQLAVPGTDHEYYLVTASDHGGNESAAAAVETGATATPDAGPARFVLHPCAPNPFNPRTTIAYAVPSDGRVRLRIFDLAGRLVTTLVDDVLAAGAYETEWKGRGEDGAQVPSGVYVSRLEAAGRVAHGQMTLVR